MKKSFRAFMNEMIDYAGLFPPADLSLDAAIHRYSDYRKEEDSWMLARFIIPALRLDELTPYADTLLKDGHPFRFSILGRGTETVSEFTGHLQELAGAIRQFHSGQQGDVTTDLLEIKLPREAAFANDPELLAEVFEKTAGCLGEGRRLPSEVFFEAHFEENWEKDIHNTLKALQEFNDSINLPHFSYAGFKLRCGGVKASMFPSTEQVAFVLTRAREQNIAVKGTAGLHHPVRHYADEVQAKMHGFFNVFGGAMLSYAHDLSQDELETIIAEEDPDHFSFTEEEFRWNGLGISAGEIKELRQSALISFGSCSFDEPREDLQQLGLM